jgi:drug/metabolite transporter (DMT)-like permease
MELWLSAALLTVVLYGLGEGLSKEPTVRLGPGRMLALYSLYSVPIYSIWFFVGGGLAALNPTGIVLGAASALSGAIGNVLWFRALESGKASVVSGFTAAYPVVTVVAAVVGLGATLVPQEMVAIALLVAAAVLLGIVGHEEGSAKGRAWVAPMLVAVVLWGIWGIFEKLAIGSIGFAGNAGVYVLVSTPLFLVVGWRDARGRPRIDRNSFRSAQPTLMLFAVAGITIFYAIGLGPLAVVVPLTTAYPVIAILFRRWWHEERMTRAQKLAVGLALVGAALAGL